jgi:hypothetical protein
LNAIKPMGTQIAADCRFKSGGKQCLRGPQADARVARHLGKVELGLTVGCDEIQAGVQRSRAMCLAGQATFLTASRDHVCKVQHQQLFLSRPERIDSNQPVGMLAGRQQPGEHAMEAIGPRQVVAFPVSFDKGQGIGVVVEHFERSTLRRERCPRAMLA